MKKHAMTTLEVIIAMGLIAAAAMLSLNTLYAYINKDTDIIKFKHAFTTISEVVSALKNDSVMYPTAFCFKNMETKGYMGENATYGGEDKFRKLFISKYNVLENNIKVKFDSIVPLIKYKDNSNNELYKTSNTINCFLENKGFVLCPPPTNIGKNEELASIYIPVYVNNTDEDKGSLGLDKAIFVEVGYDGKIELPPIVEYYPKRAVIDCTDKNFNSYTHCKVLDKMMDTDF